jgi:hypothetical protein
VLLVNKDSESSSPVVVEVPPQGQAPHNIEPDDKQAVAKKTKVCFCVIFLRIDVVLFLNVINSDYV